MGRALWLADVFRDAGLRVSPVHGWETRGSSSFNPKWLVEHHTASNKNSGNAPALGIVTHGRTGLAGPLANWLTARDGTIFVVASGRANHAGVGRYPDGSSGNSLSFGDEAENNGIGEPWPGVQKDAIERAGAAVCRYLNWGASRIVGHKEYATPQGRKIDPTYDMGAHRAAVQARLGAGPGPLPPTTPGGKSMYTLVRHPGGEISTFDGTTRAAIPGPDALGGHQILLAALGYNNAVHNVSADFYNSLPARADIAFDLTVSRGNIDETVAATVAGVIAALPPTSGGPVDVQAIATATANELAKRLGNG